MISCFSHSAIFCKQTNSQDVHSKFTSITTKIHNFEKSRFNKIHDSIEFIKQHGKLDIDNLKKLSKDISSEISHNINFDYVSPPDNNVDANVDVDVTNIDDILDENDTFFEN